MTIPFHGNISFNAHHSPMGAYFTFTCGHFGTRGGLAAQLGKPANQDLFIGIKDGDRYSSVPLKMLPFFDGADKLDPKAAFTPEHATAEPQRFAPYTKEQIKREYGWCIDRWKTADLEFSIYSPFGPIPDPSVADAGALRMALLPAITAELIIDNRHGTHTKTGFFAINFHEGGSRILDEGLPPRRVGFALKSNLGVIGEVADMTASGSPAGCDAITTSPFVFLRWWPHEGLEDKSNPVHLLGTTPGIGVEVPPGKCYTLRLSLGCHLPEIVTTRLEGRYFYTRYFGNLLDVLNTAGDRFCELKRASKIQDGKLRDSGLNPDQQFLIAHATRSYYGNTQLLDIGGEPYWIVNEGEYCMMNTLDLAVDQVFWELEQNPWVVRNLLDNCLKRYSYVDEVKISTTESTENTETTTKEKNSVISVSSVVKNPPPPLSPVAPGGISFCHDQGSHNQFSPFGHSAYELKDLTGCFSYMTQEQLCNWILIAASYVAKTGDEQWARSNLETFSACYLSMRNRDNERKKGAKGIMQRDSARCGTGEEITTYDSLDASLGQARNNLYLAVKCWAAFMGLDNLCEACIVDASSHISPNSATLFDHSNIGANTIASQLCGEQFIPAIFAPGDPPSRILAAIEGLKFPLYWNELFVARRGPPKTEYESDLPIKFAGGSYAEETGAAKMLAALRTHTVTLLSDPEHRNKFPDGGILLSSTSDNTWLSKIAIVQHVARTLFDLDENGNARNSKPETRNAPATGWECADAAHVRWLTTGPGAYWCASDQIVNGIAQGSRYYPRLITTALWLSNSLDERS